MNGLLVLSAVAVLFAGCSSRPTSQPVAAALPPEGVRVATPEEQRKLREEARENFARLKEEHSGTGRRTIARADRPEYLSPVEEAPRRLAYVPEVAWQPASSRSAADEDAAERARELEDRRWEAQQRMNNYRAFEAGYARQLGKKPAQLTRDERAWVRDNFE